MPSTHTQTNTYTKPRIEVVRDQFELFLRYTGISSTRLDALLLSIERGELASIGAYLEKDGCRLMEVEVEVDWELHAQLKNAEGDLFDTDLPGWEENASPEVNMYAHRISRVAKDLDLKVRHWILVDRRIRADPEQHKKLCDSLGFSFKSSVPPWPDGKPSEKGINVLDLPEAKIYQREA